MKFFVSRLQKRNVLVSMKLCGLWRPEGQLFQLYILVAYLNAIVIFFVLLHGSAFAFWLAFCRFASSVAWIPRLPLYIITFRFTFATSYSFGSD